MIDYASIGQKLREARLRKGVTQEQLADLVSDCSGDEVKIIADTVASLKQSLRKNRIKE